MSDKRNNEKLGPPVDPLSNAAWSRVERGVFERLDNEAPRAEPQRARWPWVAVPVVLAAAAFATVLITHDKTPPAVPPPIAQSSDEPSRVVAGNTPSTVSFGDAHLTLSPNAAIVMNHENAGPAVTLDRGATTFEVAPRNGRPAFVVRAADVVVRVVGTKFTVTRADERVDVDVAHGIVEVQYKTAVTRVTGGQHWSSTEPVADPLRDQFDRYAAMEPSNYKSAITGYLELAKTQSTWAPVALYAAGRLAAERKDPRARALLAEYLQRFPAGANAADARDLLGHLR